MMNLFWGMIIYWGRNISFMPFHKVIKNFNIIDHHQNDTLLKYRQISYTFQVLICNGLNVLTTPQHCVMIMKCI